MRRDLEAAAALEEKLRKADEEAKALKEEQKRVEEEKARLAEAAASQKKQTEEEVSIVLKMSVIATKKNDVL